MEQHLDLALRVASRDRGRVAITGSAQQVRDDPRLLQYLAP
jgi:branched-chain amino acid transport system ATP-binding protein